VSAIETDGGSSPITELIDVATIQAIADEAWLALLGEDEVLVPLPGEPAGDAVSGWVEIVGPWTGAVVLTCGDTTAQRLARHLLREHAPEVLDEEDVADALGELANVVGGNVKAALPGPSVLGLPEVGTAPTPHDPADVCRIDALWRGEALSVSVQGSPGPLPDPQNDPHTNEVSL
jgi:chemotaxis protein CheX